MNGPRIAGLPCEKMLDHCQEPRHAWTVLLLVYLGICASLPATIFSGSYYSIAAHTLSLLSCRQSTRCGALEFSLEFPADRLLPMVHGSGPIGKDRLTRPTVTVRQ